MRKKQTDEFKQSEEQFEAFIVHLILDGKADEAVEHLAGHYGVASPRIKVGLPKRHSASSTGCYTVKNRTIHVLSSDVLKDPFIILHEFYHHLRTSADRKHRGTEKRASQFARDFILNAR